MLRYYLVIFLSIFVIESFAQVPYQSNSVAPGPGASAGLGTPVSLYSGTPGISVPIYSIQGAGISIPIGLSYRATGIKVQDIASWVGLGWNLNAGGGVTRVVRGLPDDHPTRGFYSTDTDHLNTTNEVFGTSPFDLEDPNNPNKPKTTFNCDDEEPNTNADALKAISQGCYDIEPDVFYIKAPGLNAEFVYDRSGTMHFRSYQSLKVEKQEDASGYIEAWIITTLDGSRYTFGKVGGKTSVQKMTRTGTIPQDLPEDCPLYDEYISTWDLLQIESPSRQETIYFDYVAEYTSFRSLSETAYKHIFVSNIPNTYTIHENTLNGTRLKSIRSTLGHQINFKVQEIGRVDLQGGHALEEIEVYYRGNKIKSLKFTYEYYQHLASDQGHEPTLPTILKLEEKSRLKLKSVQEFNPLGQSVPPYVFEYEGEGGLTPGLPARLSLSYDLWGYFNGELNTGYLSCNMARVSQAEQILYYRRAVFPETQKGILNKVTYPTGGYSEFTYEPHTYSNFGGGLLTWENKELQRHEEVVNITAGQSYQFTIPEGFGNVQACFAGNSITACVDNCFADPSDPDNMLNLYEQGNSMIETQVGTLCCDNLWITGIGTNVSLLPYVGNGLSLTLGRGESYIIHSTGVSANFKITYFTVGQTSLTNKEGGGLRIKNIKTYDNPSASPLTKHYEYTEKYTYTVEDEDGNESSVDGIRSSGRMKTHHNYRYTISLEECDGTSMPGNRSLQVISSESFGLGSNSAGNVGYNEVTVIYEDKEERGKIVYKYSNPEMSTNGETATFPFLPRGLADMHYGLLEEVSEHRWLNDGGHPDNPLYHNYQTIKKNQIFYDSTLKSSSYGVRFQSASSNDCDNCYANFKMNSYELPSWQILRTKTIESFYDKQGNVTFNETLYEYDEQYNFLTKMSTKDSEGKILETNYKYLGMLEESDITGNDALELMKERHQLGVPLSQTIYQTRLGIKEVLAHQETVFQKQNEILNNSGQEVYSAKVLPTTFKVLETQNPIPEADLTTATLLEQISYNEYDEEGNILSISEVDRNDPLDGSIKDKGLTKSYIYTQEDSYIAAEVLNAEANEIAYTSFEYPDQYAPYGSPSNPEEGNWKFPTFVESHEDVSSGFTGTGENFMIEHYPQTLRLSYDLKENPSFIGAPQTQPYLVINKHITEGGEEVYRFDLNNVDLSGEITTNILPGLYTFKLVYEGTDTPYDIHNSSASFRYTRRNYASTTPPIFTLNSEGKTGDYSVNCKLHKDVSMGTYKLSFWAKGNPSKNIIISDLLTTANISQITGTVSDSEWTYFEYHIQGNANMNIEVNPEEGVWLDELRLHPIDASMTTYTYENIRKKVSTLTDSNNHCLHYEYDDFGRLKYVKDEDGNIVKNYEYHYAGDNN